MWRDACKRVTGHVIGSSNFSMLLGVSYVSSTGVVQKMDTQFYFWDNFGNSARILTILSLLQAEIYGA